MLFEMPSLELPRFFIPRKRKLKLAPTDFLLGGIFEASCWDKDGRLVWRSHAKNGVTDVGAQHALNVLFGGGTQVTTWYIGLVDNAGYTAFAFTDTMSSHGGWSEVSGSNFSNGSRPSWTPGTPSGSSGAWSVVNASTVNYNMTNSGALTLKGMFLVSDATKAGTSGTLVATAPFTVSGTPTTQAVNNGDTVKITYTMNATAS